MAKPTDYIELLMAGLPEPVKIPLEGMSAEEKKALRERVARENATIEGLNIGLNAKRENDAAVEDLKAGALAGAAQRIDASNDVADVTTPGGRAVRVRRQPGQSRAEWSATVHKVMNYPSVEPKPLPEDKDPIPPYVEPQVDVQVGEPVITAKPGMPNYSEPAPELPPEPQIPSGAGGGSGSNFSPAGGNESVGGEPLPADLAPPTTYNRGAPPPPLQINPGELPTAQAPAAPPAEPPLLPTPNIGIPAAPAPVDWAKVNQAAQDIAKEQQGIVEANAKVEQAGLKAQAETRQTALAQAAQLAANEAAAQNAYTAEKAKHQQAYEALAAQRQELSKQAVDPYRWWNNKTGGEKVASYLAAALFGFAGQGMDYLKRIDSEIDRDVKMQQMEFERRDRALVGAMEASQTLYGMARQNGLDAHASYLAARSQLFEDLAQKIDIQALNLKSDMALGNAKLVGAELRAKALDEGSKFLHYGEEAAQHVYATKMTAAVAMMHEAAANARANNAAIENRTPAQTQRFIAQLDSARQSLVEIKKKLDAKGFTGDLKDTLSRVVPRSGIRGHEAGTIAAISAAASRAGDTLKPQIEKIQSAAGLGLSAGPDTRALVDEMIDTLDARIAGAQKDLSSAAIQRNARAAQAQTPSESFQETE